MTHVVPVFPKSVFSWTDRIDEVNYVFANDPNSLASEVISIEKTLGVMPQVEKSPYAGPNVVYNTVDDRMSDLLAGTQHPYAQFIVNSDLVSNGNTFAANVGNAPGKPNSYIPIWDNFNFYNGTDATISIPGVYLITAWQEWPFNTQGYVALHLYLQNPTGGGGSGVHSLPAWQNMSRFSWDFPQSGPTRWDRTGFNNRQAMTPLTWLGVIEEGWRVILVSENGTATPTQKVINGSLRIACLRKIPTNIYGLSGQFLPGQPSQ